MVNNEWLHTTQMSSQQVVSESMLIDGIKW